MSSRDNILSRLRAVSIADTEKPQLEALRSICFEDKVSHFAEVVKSVGGEAVEMGKSLEQTLTECSVDCSTLVSSLEELPQAINPNTVADVHELGGEYTTVVRGKIGIAENGAVWVPIEDRYKAHIFACKHLVILLDKSSVVDTMHDAVMQISLEDLAYGAFISGPSKTADIEQALVMGAHGAMKATIILI